MDLSFQIIRVRELESFLESDLFRRSRVLPISPQRAVSQARNPRAELDDVALLMVVVEGQVLAYLGAMAEVFYLAEGPQRVGWLTCLWVSPELRGQGVATRLLTAMTAHWGGLTILTEFAPATRKMYERSGIFRETEALLGFRGYLRPNLADILPPKRAFFERIKPVLQLTDATLGALNALRLRFFRVKMPRFRYVTGVDAATERFIQNRQNSELPRRNAAALNWLLQHPWVNEAPWTDDTASRYHFSSVARTFQQIPMQMLDNNGNITAFVLLTLRDGHLKIPYAYFDVPQTAAVADLIVAQALCLPVKMLSCYHAGLVEHFRRSRTPFFFQKSLRRSCFASADLWRQLPPGAVTLQDGDGDVGFT